MGWSCNKLHYFYTDDYDWIIKSSNYNILDYIHIFPVSPYNDRPVGALIIGLMYYLFSLSAQKYYFCLLIIHTINSMLTFKVTEKLTTDRLFALFVSVLFCMWYPAHKAVYWIGAIFDLSALTLILSSMLLYLNNRIISSVFFYFLAARTKELAIMLPSVLFFLEFFIFHKKIKAILTKQFIFYLVFGAIALQYLLLFKNNNNFLVDKSCIYHQSVTLIDFFSGLGFYLTQFFNFKGFGADSHSTYLYVGIFFTISTLIAVSIRAKQAFYFLSFILFSLATLFLKNHRDLLYNYIPSVFLITLMGSFILHIKNSRLRVSLMTLIVTCVCLLNLSSTHWKDVKNWTLKTTSDFESQHLSFLKKYPVLKGPVKIFIINDTPLNGLNNNNQDALRVLCHNNDISYARSLDESAIDIYNQYKGKKILINMYNSNLKYIKDSNLK